MLHFEKQQCAIAQIHLHNLEFMNFVGCFRAMLCTLLYSLVSVQALHVNGVPEIPNVLSSFISKVNKLNEKEKDAQADYEEKIRKEIYYEAV